MKRILHPIVAFGLAVAACFVLTACGTPSAKDFGGRWRPVNQLARKVIEVPLAPPYAYYVAPIDATLKSVLTRWTADTGMNLAYKLRSDFTLPRSTAALHTSELRDAVAQLSAAYARQGIVVKIEGPDLIVEEVSASMVPDTPTPSTTSAATPIPVVPEGSHPVSPSPAT